MRVYCLASLMSNGGPGFESHGRYPELSGPDQHHRDFRAQPEAAAPTAALTGMLRPSSNGKQCLNCLVSPGATPESPYQFSRNVTVMGAITSTGSPLSSVAS
jgi:hypothetical protein